MKLTTPLWRLGFRPFFLLAGIFGALAIFVWMGIYAFSWPITPSLIPITTWHAHEMIYGYAMAVIAGFLLTAVRNWTKIDTLNGWPLALLASSWLTTRILAFTNFFPLWVTALFNITFLIGLGIAIGIPIHKSKNWKNLAILVKIIIFIALNLSFYLGALGILPGGTRIGLYGGLYLIIALIVMIGRRVIPFFTGKGIEAPLTLRNRKWLDISSLILFVLFYILVLISPQSQIVGMISIALAILYTIRLYDWYTPYIWEKPLIWILHLAYFTIVLGFILTACSIFLGISSFLAIHAFSYGSIGLSTIGMMSRVSLGHTGRSIHDPPKLIKVSFILLAIGTIVRCLLPIIFPGYYTLLIISSQVLWISAFIIFIIVYLPIWISPRVDGKWA
jgi:uncharacterized protein involved in response to NO